MKVAIWGSYNHGNYGDDLMALQFAITLKKMGVDSCIYRLDPILAKNYSVNTTNSLNDLFTDASFCIVGGGGFLVENIANYEDIENDFRELLLISSAKKCPVFPISVGGDGKGVKTNISYWRKAFWSSDYCKGGTIRLKEDISLVYQLGKEATFYPDILLSIDDLWEIKSDVKLSNKINVGVNISKSLPNKFLASQIRLVTKTRKDIIFHFIRTHLPNYSHDYEILPQESSCIKQHRYSDPIETLNFLKSLDLLVSNKLHLGLTALSLNVPFYSFGRSKKAHSFLKSIDATKAIFPYQNTLQLIYSISSSENILKARDYFNFNYLDTLKEMSIGHIKYLESLINTSNSL